LALDPNSAKISSSLIIEMSLTGFEGPVDRTEPVLAA
jgi:hypothetical protein